MTYRKFKADHLFTGREMKGGDTVLVTDEEGVVEAILPLAEAGEDVERLDGMLSPGFVNCHCHLELSHMKGVIPEGTGLVDFLLAVMRQRGGSGGAAGTVGTAQPGSRSDPGAGAIEHSGSDPVIGAMSAAEEEMLAEGIVAIGDICNTTDSLPLKTGGRLYYHNFIETMGFIEEGARGRLENSCRVFAAFAEAYSLPIASNSLTPHAPYSVSAALFGLIAGFPGNQLLTIHNQESEAENEFYLRGDGDLLRLYAAMGIDVSFFRGTGKRSLGSILPHFYRNQTLILVHNLVTNEEDLRLAMGRRAEASSERSAGHAPAENPATGDLAKGPNLYFCLCPNANLYISGRLPDPELLMKYDCPIVLGTDSLASNHRLSILEEAKTLQRQWPRLPTATLLQWATHDGARALNLDSALGSLEPGRQPGIVLIGNMEGERLGEHAKARRLL
jgi:cytosine/adenosine deaminase-related metal-dependent hydrolase